MRSRIRQIADFIKSAIFLLDLYYLEGKRQKYSQINLNEHVRTRVSSNNHDMSEIKAEMRCFKKILIMK